MLRLDWFHFNAKSIQLIVAFYVFFGKMFTVNKLVPLGSSVRLPLKSVFSIYRDFEYNAFSRSTLLLKAVMVWILLELKKNCPKRICEFIHIQ